MEIRASSKYDWETIKQFNKFHNFTKAKVLNVVVIVTDVICALLFLLALSIDILDFELMMLYVLILFLNLVLVFARFVLPKIQYKQNKLLHGVENKITFEEDQMLIEQHGENTNATATMKYDAIWKVYEAKEYIYIYVNSRQAYIVDKSTVVGGTAMNLRMFLVKNVGMSKYKVKCKV